MREFITSLPGDLDSDIPTRGDDPGPTVTEALGFRRYDISKLRDETPTEIPWQVEGVIPRGALVQIYGLPGVAKSLWANCMAAGIASGLTEGGFNCTKGSVAIVDAENGEWEVGRRVKALGLPDGVDYFEPPWDFDLQKDMDKLEGLLTELCPDVLILDSFRSLYRGSENESHEIAAALDPLRGLAHQHNTGIVFLHHQGKHGRTSRGSGAIEGCVELSFQLERVEGDPISNRRVLRCRKCRIGPEPEDKWFRVSWGDGMVFIDQADPFHSASGMEVEKSAVNHPLRRSVWEHYLAHDGEPVKRADVCRALDKDTNDRTVRRIVESLESEGLLKLIEDAATVTHTTADEGGGVASTPMGADTLTPGLRDAA